MQDYDELLETAHLLAHPPKPQVPGIAVVSHSGGTAASALLAQSQGTTRLGGRWFDLAGPGPDQPVPTLPMFHPSFLLRTPERKREAWRDLLSLRARLGEFLAAALPSG